MDWDDITKALTVIWLTVQIAAKLKELFTKGNGKSRRRR